MTCRDDQTGVETRGSDGPGIGVGRDLFSAHLAPGMKAA
jgi:hypothetical protein